MTLGGQPQWCYGIDEQRNVNTEHIGALQAHKSGGSSQIVAQVHGAESETFIAQEPVAYNWQSGGDVRLSFGLPNLQANQVPAVGVRRLTPTECERLQGFPDGWTTGQSDSARYRQLGNAVCVPVAEWIGRQIVAVENS